MTLSDWCHSSVSRFPRRVLCHIFILIIRSFTLHYHKASVWKLKEGDEKKNYTLKSVSFARTNKIDLATSLYEYRPYAAEETNAKKEYSRIAAIFTFRRKKASTTISILHFIENKNNSQFINCSPHQVRQ